MFLFSIYEPPIILYSSYINPRSPRTRSSNTPRTCPRTLARPSSCPRESSFARWLAVDHGVFGVFGDVFGDVRVKFKSGQRFSKFKMASIGVDGALGVAELGIIS